MFSMEFLAEKGLETYRELSADIIKIFFIILKF
jgi:hypothetical protein